jgi:prepilin-type N-terminal cleavage/methylation domain-containing protein
MKKVQAMQGYTLLELIMVIALIAILSSVFVPKVSSVVRRSQDSTSKGKLASLRSTISVYTADHDGKFPTDNLNSLVPNYISAIPTFQTISHGENNEVITEVTPSDSGKWSYNNAAGVLGYGSLSIGCTHTDSSAKPWNTY